MYVGVHRLSIIDPATFMRELCLLVTFKIRVLQKIHTEKKHFMNFSCLVFLNKKKGIRGKTLRSKEHFYSVLTL